MFWRRYLLGRTHLYINHLCRGDFRGKNDYIRSYSGISRNLNKKYFISFVNKYYGKIFETSSPISLSIQKFYSKGILEGDSTQLENNEYEKEIQKVTELFPRPRETLNVLNAKTPQKIFDIHYKQNVLTHKGGKKKKSKIVSNDWTCTYAFIWPEKNKFEVTAISKRQAAEKAAVQALHYLYLNKRIDHKGLPIYDKDKIQELKSTLQEPLIISISDKSVERIDRIWDDYEGGIKDVFQSTFEEAQKRIIATAPVLKKDSTLEEEDEFPTSDSTPDEVSDITELKVPVHPVYGKIITPPSASTIARKSELLKKKFERYVEEIVPLPLDQYANQITATLSKSRVVVIVGAAGCGKSTRAPAAVLRHYGADANILVSEPRRIAAIGLADTVARDLGEEDEFGAFKLISETLEAGLQGETIGYQVRLRAKPPRPPAGSILYCTSGVLLRRLHNNPGLEGCTHVFIDEAHERDVNTDVTLLLLKRALDINPLLKVVVMSATLDIQVFTRYFSSCPVIEVPGRAYPVEVSYLDDIGKTFNLSLPHTLDNCQKEDGKPQINCQEMVKVIKAVDKTQPEGAILVFLPGWAEIKSVHQLLEREFSESSYLILPIHSRLSTTDQTKMFARPLPGVRKIVLATNIAETSITIPDVVYVIDSGAHKENRMKEGTGTASLDTVWVSAAGAKQRAGRAGRVQPGHCYKLYTKEKEEQFNPHTTPEILRVPLEQTVLDCKTYDPVNKVESFLSQLPEPPSRKAIQFAVNDLVDLGALTQSEQMTRLGSMLSGLSLPPRLGASLLHAAVAGAVTSLARVVTLIDHTTPLFIQPQERREEIREIKREFNATSDHCALHWIQSEFERVLSEVGWSNVDKWCEKYGLKKERLGYVKSLSTLHLEQALNSGLIEPTIEPEELTRFSDVDEITTALLLSGSNSFLRTKKHVRTKGKLRTVIELFTSTGDRAHIGSESVNHDILKRKQNCLSVYFGGYHSTERRALVVYSTSLIPPHTALLFCKGKLEKEIVSEGDKSTAILTLPRHKLQVHMPVSQAERIIKAKEMLWNTFRYYLERDLKTLDYDMNTRISRFKVRLLKAIGRMLVEGHREYVEGKKVEEIVDR